jgi:hypothetical protein
VGTGTATSPAATSGHASQASRVASISFTAATARTLQVESGSEARTRTPAATATTDATA